MTVLPSYGVPWDACASMARADARVNISRISSPKAADLGSGMSWVVSGGLVVMSGL